MPAPPWRFFHKTMTSFKFRLDAVLRLRQMQAEAETARLQELLAQSRALQKALLAAQDERLAAASFVHENKDVKTVDLRALSSFMLGLEARSKTLTDAIARVEQQILQQRKRLLKAQQAARALDKLRAKRLTEWKLASDREIEATAQELWLFAHTKNIEASNSG